MPASPRSSLRITTLVGDYPATSKTFVTDQLLHLVRAGHAVQVVADPVTAPSALPEDLVGRIQYRGRRRTGPRRSTRSRPLRLAAGAALLLRPSASTGLSRRSLIALMRVVADAGPADVFLCHFGVLGNELVRVRSALGLDTPIVTAFHGYDVSSYLARHGEAAFAELFERGDLFLPVSEHWRQRLLELGAPPDRVVVHRMGVDVRHFASRVLVRGDGPLRVLSVGRLVEKKGTEFGLRAVASLRAVGLPVLYTVIGDGPRRRALEELAGELGVDDVVTFTGARTREQVRAALQEHDVFLCPSVTSSDGDSEGIPVVLMEAMATGLPVVSTWHSGIPELVVNGVSGLLAPERDADAIASHLKALALDETLAVRLGSKARAKVEAEYDVRVLCRRLEERLLEVTVGGASRSARRP